MQLTIANLLVAEQPERAFSSPNIANKEAPPHWLLETAKADVRQMLQVIQNSGGYFKFQTMEQNRLDALKTVYERITIV